MAEKTPLPLRSKKPNSAFLLGSWLICPFERVSRDVDESSYGRLLAAHDLFFEL